MPRNRGFSLVELMVALTLSVGLGLAMLAMLRQFLEWNGNLGLLMDRDQSVRQGPLLLSRHLAAAGNHRWAGSWTGLRISGEEVLWTADLTGEDGFPDGRLESSFESVAVRGRDGHLQIRSGGSSYQPLLKNVRDFEVIDWSPPLLRLQLVLQARRKLRTAGTEAVEPVELAFFVWNHRRNWFEERSP